MSCLTDGHFTRRDGPFFLLPDPRPRWYLTAGFKVQKDSVDVRPRSCEPCCVNPEAGMYHQTHNSLPPEIWVMVSAMLWDMDVKSLRLACASWARLFKGRLLSRLVFDKNVQGLTQWLGEDLQACRTVKAVALLDGVVAHLSEFTALVSKGRLRALKSFYWRVRGHELPTFLLKVIDLRCPCLRHISIGDISTQSAKVVEGFRSLKGFEFEGRGIAPLKLDRLLRSNPDLSLLHVHSNSVEVASGGELTLGCLREISVIGDSWTLDLLTETPIPSLTSLTLNPTSNGFDWRLWLSLHSDHYPNLTHIHLTIDHNHPQRDCLPEVLPPFLAKHHHLQCVLLTGLFDDQLVRDVLKSISYLPKLIRLDIGVEILSHEMNADLVSFLPQRLEDFTLRIQSSEVPEIEWEAFLNVVSSLPNLRSVGLEGPYLNGAKRLAYVVSKVMAVAPHMEFMRLGTNGEFKDYRITVDLGGIRRWVECSGGE